MRLPISLVVIAYNEERHIERCLKSVPFASEIIVVDSFSQDKTVEKAKAAGARVESHKFEGYREQKQWASDKATQPWVLSLDADEYLSPEIVSEIQEKFKNGEPACDGFRMPRLSFHMGKWIRHGGWYPDYQFRLYKKTSARWIGSRLHEKVDVQGKVETLRGDILHQVFGSLAEQIETNNKFSSLGALEYGEKGVRFSCIKLFFRPIGKFIECYIVKRGFLDGLPGFIIAVGAAYSLFLRYAKLWEIQVHGGKSNGKQATH